MFLKTGTVDDDFKLSGKQKTVMHLLFSFERTGASLEARILMSIAGITSGEQAYLIFYYSNL